jgi:hypothetical protein
VVATWQGILAGARERSEVVCVYVQERGAQKGYLTLGVGEKADGAH